MPKKIISAGGIVFKKSLKRDRQYVVALILVYGKWMLPKGKLDKGETKKEAAVREVREEAGVNAKILGKVGATTYGNKTSHFYLMQYLGGSTKDHDDEVHDVRWFYSDVVLKKLAYGRERKIYVKAFSMFGKLSGG